MVRDGPSSSREGAPGEIASSLSDLDASSEVLVLSAGDGDHDGVCRALLVPAADETEQVIFLSLTEGVEGCLERLGDPSGLRKIHVITPRQESSAMTVTAGESTELVTQRIADPSDLPRLGIATSKAVTTAEAEGRIRICVDSLTAMLQYADRSRVYRFVQVLQDRLDRTDTVAHYHMNPDAHDQQTVETLRQLFDTVVEISADGTVETAD